MCTTQTRPPLKNASGPSSRAKEGKVKVQRGQTIITSTVQHARGSWQTGLASGGVDIYFILHSDLSVASVYQFHTAQPQPPAPTLHHNPAGVKRSSTSVHLGFGCSVSNEVPFEGACASRTLFLASHIPRGARSSPSHQHRHNSRVTMADSVEPQKGPIEATKPSTADAEIVEAIRVEHELTFIEAARLYPKAIGWSAFVSMGVIMLAFDPQLLGNLYSMPQFAEDFGHKYKGEVSDA